jgi:hypothetical protein
MRDPRTEPRVGDVSPFSEEFDRFVDMLCKAGAVLWFCPKGCRGYVEHYPYKRCLECGYAEGTWARDAQIVKQAKEGNDVEA